ncbi:large subunit ribosomal protein L4 [Arcanobacterium wilhelmae]|uniref:Large ribosomal subunit protein uL4 n=1 Tax=Arcanobacterium wilhelmae TaxID=1803177 RepID=A0ABT9NCD5_9ACTO|nr:50S ribosomal protein L4 [Arcanobacterium wilhelmae]MDP9801386.1 large subunit ribosomal protein L4 [Arcanobacterium wilhelmae]WFN90721.1 50S ribosomal protein L4 [Arcanobacterium wilhelmae]
MADFKVDVLDATGKKTGDVTLAAELFDLEINIPLIHQVVVAQLAAARQGTHKTKTRAEVSGGGVKPFKQKGTGRARQGSIRAPHFTGGGIVHGPQPRSYAQRTPKKMIAAALRQALSDRARNGRIHVVTEFLGGEKPSTKTALGLLNKVAQSGNALVVIERSDDLSALSLRNAQEAHVLYADQLNAYDVLVADDVIFTEAALNNWVAANSKEATK